MSIRDSISVIIPTFNKVERLRIVLEAFTLQSLDPSEFEVVVVVDGSEDGTEEFLRSYSPPFSVRHLRQAHQGRSEARNRGIEGSCHSILVFCDDDTVPRPCYLEAHQRAQRVAERRVVHGCIYSLPYLRFFRDPATGERYDGQADVGEGYALQRLLLAGAPHKVQTQCERQKKLSLFERQVQEILTEPQHPLRWLGCTGGNVSIRREALNEVGAFDTRFGLLWGGEDLELGYRAVQKGLDVAYSEEAACYHINHYRATFREELETSVSLFCSKHDDPHVKCLARLLLGEIREPAQYMMLVAKGLPSTPSDSNAQLRQ